MNENQKNDKPKEKDLVFHIRVQYRQNSSMQGSIQWLDGKKSTVFRSVLELGHLINDAKQQTAGTSHKKPEFDRWQDKGNVS